MGDQTWFNTVALVMAGTVVVVSGFMFTAAGSPPPRTAPSAVSPPTGYLHVTIGYDTATRTDSVSISSLVIHAHMRVIVTVTNYDPTTGPLFVPWDRQVIGTYGGALGQARFGNTTYSFSSLPSTGVSHTLSVHDAFYNLSLPIPPSHGSLTPAVVTFVIEMNWTDVSVWGCMDRCHPDPMAAGMYGTFTVAA